MTHYSVRLHAEGEFDGGSEVGRLGGFYVVRIVEANSSTEASAAAIARLYREEKYAIIVSRCQGEGLDLSVEAVDELSTPPPKSAKDSGYTFYPSVPNGGGA